MILANKLENPLERPLATFFFINNDVVTKSCCQISLRIFYLMIKEFKDQRVSIGNIISLLPQPITR